MVFWAIISCNLSGISEVICFTSWLTAHCYTVTVGWNFGPLRRPSQTSSILSTVCFLIYTMVSTAILLCAFCNSRHLILSLWVVGSLMISYDMPWTSLCQVWFNRTCIALWRIFKLFPLFADDLSNRLIISLYQSYMLWVVGRCIEMFYTVFILKLSAVMCMNCLPLSLGISLGARISWIKPLE